MAGPDEHPIRPKALDHVALWVGDRAALAEFLCAHLGLHEIERTGDFTLVGADARRGKLTLFAAEGPREPGALERVVLRVPDLERALAALPAGVEVERPAHDLALFEGPERLRLGLVARDDAEPEYDIDHVVLRVSDPARTGRELQGLGFDADDGRLSVADKHVQLERGDRSDGAKPLLNHLALLVDSAGAVRDAAVARGLDVADFVDAPNTLAVFVNGPEGVKLEYVEHKPGFALG